MSSRKRSRHSGLDADELGGIKLADGDSIAADLLLARACSSCARCLPAAAQEWDLSGMQIDGQPAERETVTAWLGCVDNVINHAPIPDSSLALTTATGLQKLLSFVDAVGSSDGVLHTCISKLQNLQLTATVGEQQLQLLTDGRAYHWVIIGDDEWGLWWTTITGSNDQECDVKQQQRLKLVQELAAQTEALLVTAHKLQLHTLIQHLQRFIFSNLAPRHDDGGSLFCGVGHLLFTDRLLDAALGSSTMSKGQYISSVLACGAVEEQPARASALQPIASSLQICDVSRLINFDARLGAPLLGSKQGGTTRVQLDLFNSSDPALNILGSSITLPVQLLIGHKVNDAADLARLFPAV